MEVCGTWGVQQSVFGRAVGKEGLLKGLWGKLRLRGAQMHKPYWGCGNEDGDTDRMRARGSLH